MLKERKKWIYAVYKGENMISMGTREEICKSLNIRRKTFEYYRSNAYKKRLENRYTRNAREIIKMEG